MGLSKVWSSLVVLIHGVLISRLTSSDGRQTASRSPTKCVTVPSSTVLLIFSHDSRDFPQAFIHPKYCHNYQHGHHRLFQRKTLDEFNDGHPREEDSLLHGDSESAWDRPSLILPAVTNGVRDWSRRDVFQKSLEISVPILFGSCRTCELAHAATLENPQQRQNVGDDLFLVPEKSKAQSRDSSYPYIQRVLSDLPPPKNIHTARLFLCRHGQTENNRLHIVQGARVDPPLNDTGRQMALRMGFALSYLNHNKNTRSNNRSTHNMIHHSQLQRSIETAWITSQVLNRPDNSLLWDSSILQERNDPMNLDKYNMMNIQTNMNQDFQWDIGMLPSLAEVDFGACLVGRRELDVRMDMQRTFGAWALGNIDAKCCSSSSTTKTSGRYQTSDESGESGRSILERAATMLQTLSQQALLQNGSIIAISHSTYIRVLLALVMDIPLLGASLLHQTNGCINVIDIDTSKVGTIVRNQSKLFSGFLSMAPSNFQLEIPHVEVIRLNECRHLKGLI